MSGVLGKHWLAERLDHLDALGQARDKLTAAAARGQVPEARAREAREAFLLALDAFTAEVASRDPIVACVVGREGQVLASSGRPPDAETLAAVSRDWLSAGLQGSSLLGLGSLNQMVVVGDVFKVAMFRVGGVTVAILGPTQADLAGLLARASGHRS